MKFYVTANTNEIQGYDKKAISLEKKILNKNRMIYKRQN